MNKNLIPVILLTVGAALMWASVKNVNPLSAFKSVLQNGDLSGAVPITTESVNNGGEIQYTDEAGNPRPPRNFERQRSNQIRPEPNR